MTSSLQEWWLHLGDYKKTRIINFSIVDNFMFYIYAEFLGNQTYVQDKAKKELFKLKCYSFMPKDLDKHFKMVRQRFYLIGRLDDSNVKQAHLS